MNSMWDLLRKAAAVTTIGVVLAVGISGSTIETHAQTPSKPLVIVLDPGHGGTGDRNLGAQYNGISEKDATLKIANYAKSYLEQFDNVTVYMTRTSDQFLSLEDRVKYAASVGADFMYSIHLNASEKHDLCGCEVWVSAYDQSYEKGYEFASVEIAELTAAGLYPRGIKTKLGNNGDYYGILRHARNYGVNCALLEHLHIDHPADLAWMQSQKDPWASLGMADATAIAKYYNLKSTTLKVDYSGYKNVDIAAPATVMGHDTTAPTVCTLNSAVKSSDSKTITANVSAYDPETPIIYYRYSFDGGKNWSLVAGWNRNLRTDTLTIPNQGNASSLTIEVYNNYDLITVSNTVNIR